MKSKVFSLKQVEKAKTIKMYIALPINIVIIGLTIAGLIWSYRINYYENMDIPHNPGQKLWFWGWFTFLSTAMLGVACAIHSVFISIALAKHKTYIPNFVFVIKNAAIAATIVTFCITQYDLLKDLPTIHISKVQKANLIEHIIIPFLAIPSYILVERTVGMKLVDCCYSMIFGGLYSIHYLSVGYKFINPDGTMPAGPKGDGDRYDRYGIFKMFGPNWAWILIIGLCGSLFLFSWLGWLVNRKIHIYENKAPRVLKIKSK